MFSHLHRLTLAPYLVTPAQTELRLTWEVAATEKYGRAGTSQRNN